MDKQKFIGFLKEFAIVNAILVGVYLAVIVVVTMFFGNAMVEFAQATITGEDQNIALVVIHFLLRTVLFVAFYVLSLFRLSNNAEEKRNFFASIGTERFDLSEFSKKYFAERGKQMLIYFSVTLGVVSLADMIGVPFLSIIIVPQRALPSMLLQVFGMTGALYTIVASVFAVAVNVALYYVYQKHLCPKLYEKWASERLRVE